MTRTGPVLCAVLLLLAVYLAGCFTLDGKLNEDGSGTLDLTYPVQQNATPEGEKARWTSPHVTVKSYMPKANNQAEVSLAFDDLTKLSSAEGFENTQVTRTREGDDEIVKITIRNPHPAANAKDEGRPGPRLMIRFPAKVKEANQGGEVTEDTVVWKSTPLIDFVRLPSVEYVARYAAPSAGSTTSVTSTSTSTTTTSSTAPAKKAATKKKSKS